MVNTWLLLRKLLIDETEKTPRQLKYSKHDTEKDPYPWLDEKDPRRHMTDKEILESKIDLSKIMKTEKQKQALYKILLKYREAFSIWHEIKLCQIYGSKIEIKLQDTFVHKTLSN